MTNSSKMYFEMLGELLGDPEVRMAYLKRVKAMHPNMRIPRLEAMPDSAENREKRLRIINEMDSVSSIDEYVGFFKMNGCEDFDLRKGGSLKELDFLDLFVGPAYDTFQDHFHEMTKRVGESVGGWDKFYDIA